MPAESSTPLTFIEQWISEQNPTDEVEQEILETVGLRLVKGKLDEVGLLTDLINLADEIEVNDGN